MIFRKKVQGVITIFISLMLVSVLSLGTLVVEIARYQSAKTQLAEANISASTSMMANYDTDLYKRYGLLAVHNNELTEAKVRDYLDYNSDLSATDFGNNISRQYSISSVEIKGMYNLTYPSVLKRQLLSRAKYHVIPQDYALNRYNAVPLLSELQSKCDFVASSLRNVSNGACGGSANDVSDDMKKALTNMYKAFKGIKKPDQKEATTLTSNTMALLPSRTGIVETPTPDEDVDGIAELRNSVNSVLGADGADLFSANTVFTQTDASVDVSFIDNMTETLKDGVSDNVPSNATTYARYCVNLANGVNNAINILSSDRDGTLLLNSYITDFFSSRNHNVKGYIGPEKGSNFSGENGNFCAACVEYIFGGDGSELVNQEKAYNYLIAMRMIDNLYNVIQKSSSYRANSSYSVLAHIAWAYYESFTDVQLMARYTADIPFTKSSLILNINNPASVAAAFSTSNFVTAMKGVGVYNGSSYYVGGTNLFTYRDMLSLALWIVPNSLKMTRLSDLIQLEMRYYQQYAGGGATNFLMSEMNTYCRVKVNGKLNSILPVIAPSEDTGIQNARMTSVKYSGF